MSWWNSNAGQQYQNELARQKHSKHDDQSKIDAARKLAKTKAEKKRADKIKKERIARREKRRAEQKTRETQQKGWWR